MAHRKKQITEDLSVDRMDEFIKTNYKSIIAGFGVLILVILIGYTTINYIKSSQRGKYEVIGAYEMSGFQDAGVVEQYARLADELSFAKDYIRYQAAVEYLALDNADAAKEQLLMTGGEYALFAKSLMYDLGYTETNPDTNSPLWYYREVMQADSESKTELIAKFREEWPQSSLLGLIDKWGMQ